MKDSPTPKAPRQPRDREKGAFCAHSHVTHGKRGTDAFMRDFFNHMAADHQRWARTKAKRRRARQSRKKNRR